MKFLESIDKLSEWTGKIFSFAFIVASFVVVYAVTMRYLFNRPTVWGLELTIYLCGATYLAGGAYAEFHNAHIRIDTIYQRLPHWLRLTVDLTLTGPLLILFCVILIWYSSGWAWEAIVTWERSMTLWNPIIWPIRVLIPICTSILLLQGVARLIRDLRELKK
jgi:TRAP-type mannitol/chloroaromatic compound transport system permease small subunit